VLLGLIPTIYQITEAISRDSSRTLNFENQIINSGDIVNQRQK